MRVAAEGKGTLEKSAKTVDDATKLSPQALSERYQAMVDAFDGFIYICSRDFHVEYMNEPFLRRKGGDRTGLFCYRVLHDRDSVCPWCVNEKVWKGETVKWELKSPADSRWYYIVNVPIRHADGSMSKLAMITDITVAKTQTLALQESETRYRELADNLPLTVYEADLAGRFQFVNATGLSWFGYTAENVAAGINIVQTVIEKDRQRAMETVRQMLAGNKTVPHEYTGLRKDGSTFPVLIVTRPILEKDGRPVGIRGTVMDVTEQKQIELALQNTQKLESLGVLAGGIAHDFNNLLSGIFGYLYLARAKVTDDDAKENIDQAISVFSRAKALTQQLLTFAKGGFPVKKTISLSSVLTEAVRFALSGSNIKAAFDIQDRLWLCDADAHQIGQVIDNIIINAREAMPLGGTIAISASNVPEQGLLPAPLVKQRYVKIDVKDTGIGISPDILDRVFDPFFTTKQHGSGLGLATAYSIIKKHDGHIFAESKQSQGSTFTVYLPASFDEQEPRLVAPRQDPVKKNGTVLVMDDEEFIRKLYGKAIQEFGFTVALAANGLQAIELFKKAYEGGAPFDLIILDLTIPGGMGGVEAIVEIKKICASAVAIASSGYSDDPVMAEPEKFGFFGKLVKPFLVDDLHAVILDSFSRRPVGQ